MLTEKREVFSILQVPKHRHDLKAVFSPGPSTGSPRMRGSAGLPVRRGNSPTLCAALGGGGGGGGSPGAGRPLHTPAPPSIGPPSTATSAATVGQCRRSAAAGWAMRASAPAEHDGIQPRLQQAVRAGGCRGLADGTDGAGGGGGGGCDVAG